MKCIGRCLKTPSLIVCVSAGLLVTLFSASTASGGDAKPRAVKPAIKALLNQIGESRGVCVFLGLPKVGKENTIVELARASQLLIYVQSSSKEEVAAIREASQSAGLLGKQIWVDRGSPSQIQMASNVTDAVFAGPSALGVDAALEIQRVLHPRGAAYLGREKIVKAVPKGLDSWSHPYHGPDNNPQSTDQVARYPYLTQFLGTPMFGCISEVSVASNGRVFKAFGHIAFHEVQNQVLNTLYCVNAYNGTLLWKRPLKKGFMIHRNTMVATPETLYLADDESCKLIDARTGKIKREIKPPVKAAGGTTWKWMALKDGTLFAMLGEKEVQAKVQLGRRRGFGGWPWGMWTGYDYKALKNAFGFGRNLLAIDAKTGKIRWSRPTTGFIDGRALCMRDGKIYGYCPRKYLICLDAKSGKTIWKSEDTEMLDAIGPNLRAQHYLTGFATTAYMKAGEKHLFFAGPQRGKLVAVSTKDGKLAWQREPGNVQIVLRDDALYALGQQGKSSYRIDYDTGKNLAVFAGRRACTRATGSIDSIFCRASGGTIRYDPKRNQVQHIAPMRPPCHDGVIISDGYLYWGPWICRCKLSLFGNICLGPAGDFDFKRKANEKQQLETGKGDLTKVLAAPGGLVFTAGQDGVIRALNQKSKKVVWHHYTGGRIKMSPVQSNGRVFAGSDDGHVYALEAATGRLLWRFRAAPEVRRIPVYGKLTSTWPVAGGVVVDKGVVYAAAGIAHYDGTHVYALDAKTGRIKWHNGSSGFLNPDLRSGVSLTGRLRIVPGKGSSKALAFEGGNAVQLAKFDLDTGKCLTAPPTQPRGVATSEFHLQDFLQEQRKKGAVK